ncbi:transposon Tf2-6 polyprotein [Trichonephila clavipes]|nr:transposon Tf2-6 polyprotein [Trichonephila clavipes]
MIRWALKLSEFNIEWKHRSGVRNVVADVLSRNPVGSMDGSQISYAALRALALNSREQLIREQREDPELGHIYRYLENPDDGSVNATICEGWSQDFKLIDGLLFYVKYYTTLGELRVYIPKSLREAIIQEFHDLPLAGHLGKRKTYLKLRDKCYFPYMRKYIFEYVPTCDQCQKFNYKNVLPTGRLTPIVSNYPNEIVTLDLLGPYPASRPERYRFLLVITDHFTKWSELIPLRKASAQAIANALFENYVSRCGAPISLSSDNGPQFISEVFEHLSHRLDIKHIKTVTYRPQANLMVRVNHTLVKMIACFVEENHNDNWDRFLHEFAFALRTAVNEMTEGAEYVGGNIEKLFDEARQNMRKKHKTWEKYYNRKRREVNIKLNDLVLSVGSSELQFDHLKNGGKGSQLISTRCECTIQDSPTQLVLIVRLRHYMKDRGLEMGRVDRTQENPKDLGKPRVRRGSQSIAGFSHQIDTRQVKPPTEGSRQGTSVQNDRARETRKTPSGRNSAAEKRPVRSRQTTAVRPCPYYSVSQTVGRAPLGGRENIENKSFKKIYLLE